MSTGRVQLSLTHKRQDVEDAEVLEGGEECEQLKDGSPDDLQLPLGAARVNGIPVAGAGDDLSDAGADQLQHDEELRGVPASARMIGSIPVKR